MCDGHGGFLGLLQIKKKKKNLERRKWQNPTFAVTHFFHFHEKDEWETTYVLL